MRSSLPLASGRRGWLTFGTLSAALVAGLMTQIVPSAAAASPRVQAQAVQQPTVVEPSPEVGPASGVDVPPGPSAPAVVTPSDEPASPAAAAPKKAAPVKAPKSVAPKVAPKQAPKRARVPSPRRF